ncbi:MAG: hypothetical protein DWP97_00155 [Calditrichaeota bacterium]|nr:MAG: hypothetical protein DWP97_00155 [Calditrichota bacterium]
MESINMQTTENPFINKVDIELKRAQRYQIFISLLVYDISSVKSDIKDQSDKFQADILNLVSKKIREIDDVSLIDSSKIALLLPETNRQGAEIASKRISTVIREYLKENASEELFEKIYPEMASYPDAAGTKTIKDFITDNSSLNIN